ncbi:MAG: secretin N-terminal domain-containing protein [Gammaproteobacteria bacterium]|nr:secretin N-terminal domain-containing protein [Gammaproteobacteria bacterium]
MNKNRIFLILQSLGYSMLLFGCSSLQKTEINTEFPRYHAKKVQPISLEQLQKIPVSERIVFPEVANALPVQTKEKLYSFVAKDMPIQQAIRLFAKTYQLNILTDQDVSSVVNVDFHQLPFDHAMTALLSSMGYYWQIEQDLIRVRSWQTRIFNVNYIRLNRVGTSSSEASVSSGSSSGGGEGSGAQAGNISIKQENRIEFWAELEKQLKTLVSAEGRLVINNIAGTIQISDRHPRVKEMAQYIDDINNSIRRQVDIQVKILEVTLNDDYSLGVDWSRLASSNKSSIQTDFSLSNIITAPTGVGAALNPTLSLGIFDFGANGANQLSATINALKEQGEVKIVSQPHIRTLNNQSALIKVGTDRTFFRREQSTDTTTAGSTTSTTDVPQVVTEGIVLSITPQISKDGWVIMDVSPVITRVSSVSEVKDSTGNVLSSAPNLDIRQTSSLIRALNGETIIIGGLIQTQQSKTNRGVPGIKDVFGVGQLFEGNYENTVKKELIIFITPTVIDDSFSAINKPQPQDNRQ